MDVKRSQQALIVARAPAELRGQSAPEPTDRPETEGNVRVAISRSAGLLNRLSTLQDADDTRFRHLMGAVGSNLKAAANPQSGVVGQELGALADQLLKVAKTGDLTVLHPVSSSFTQSASTTQRALDAYRRSGPSAATPSGNVSQALDYLMTAAVEESA